MGEVGVAETARPSGAALGCHVEPAMHILASLHRHSRRKGPRKGEARPSARWVATRFNVPAAPSNASSDLQAGRAPALRIEHRIAAAALVERQQLAHVVTEAQDDAVLPRRAGGGVP